MICRHNYLDRWCCDSGERPVNPGKPVARWYRREQDGKDRPPAATLWPRVAQDGDPACIDSMDWKLRLVVIPVIPNLLKTAQGTLQLSQ
jgi:hypothetical protein